MPHGHRVTRRRLPMGEKARPIRTRPRPRGPGVRAPTAEERRRSELLQRANPRQGGRPPGRARPTARRPTAAETRAHARRSEERIGTARVKAVKAKRQAAARRRRK